MSIDLRGRNLMKLLDFTNDEVDYLVDLAIDFKDKKNKGQDHRYLEGKNIALIFEKTSTRTRGAFEVASFDLGMNVTYIGPGSSQMGHKESIKDTARVFGRFYDAIEYRGFGHDAMEEMGQYAGVPVYNGLSNDYHPTQALADIMTIKETFGSLKGLNVTYFGDAHNNVANSLMIACAKLGANFTACSPKELYPNKDLVETCKKIAEDTGASLNFTEDVEEGAGGADVLYTDVWVSMGEPDEVWEERIASLEKYRVTSDLMALANEGAIFLHCLPAFHNTETKMGEDTAKKFGVKEMEVSDEVFESESSKVFDQAENRMHTIKAVIYATLKQD